MEAVLGYSENGQVRYSILSADRIEEAIKVHEESFYQYEPLTLIYEIFTNDVATKELNQLCRIVAKEGVSVVAIDVKSDRVAGVSFNVIQEKPKFGEEEFFQTFATTQCTAEQSKQVMIAMLECDDESKFFERYNVDKLMEAMFLTVHPEHRRKNIGFDLFKYSLKLFNDLAEQSNGPKLLTVMATSAYTTKICKRLQFDTVNIIPFSKFEYKGIKGSEKVDPIHKEVNMFAKLASV